MLTKKGHSVEQLLIDVDVDVDTGGYLSVRIVAPQADLKAFSADNVDAMVHHIEERIRLEKKPSASYEKLLEQIDTTREYLIELYTKLFDVYQRTTDTAPKTRMSPKDKAMADMLSQMPDKMLREFTSMQLGDKASDFILPGERDELIDAYIAVGKNSNGAEVA